MFDDAARPPTAGELVAARSGEVPGAPERRLAAARRRRHRAAAAASRVSQLPVIDDGEVVGCVHERTLLDRAMRDGRGALEAPTVRADERSAAESSRRCAGSTTSTTICSRARPCSSPTAHADRRAHARRRARVARSRMSEGDRARSRTAPRRRDAAACGTQAAGGPRRAGGLHRAARLRPDRLDLGGRPLAATGAGEPLRQARRTRTTRSCAGARVRVLGARGVPPAGGDEPHFRHDKREEASSTAGSGRS